MDIIVPPSEKLCPRCEIIKPAQDFYKSTSSHDALSTYCKSCQSKYRERIRPSIDIPEGHKKCSICKEIKEFARFGENRRKSDKHTDWCIACDLVKREQLTVLLSSDAEKVCTKCHQQKPVSEFHKNRTKVHGIHDECKTCTKNYVKEEKIPVPDGYKRCSVCNETKRVETFYRSNTTKDGYGYECRECNKQRGKRVVTIPTERSTIITADKKCSRCGSVKPYSEFYLENGKKSNNKLASWCKDCSREAARSHARVTASYHKRRNGHLRKLYGLTLEEYEDMYMAQNGVCASCGRPEDTTIRGKVIPLTVDHCHTTQAVRGLLCRRCNQALGILCDDPERIEALLRYVQERVLY